jgi:hypothetical protein
VLCASAGIAGIVTGGAFAVARIAHVSASGTGQLPRFVVHATWGTGRDGHAMPRLLVQLDIARPRVRRLCVQLWALGTQAGVT